MEQKFTNIYTVVVTGTIRERVTKTYEIEAKNEKEAYNLAQDRIEEENYSEFDYDDIDVEKITFLKRKEIFPKPCDKTLPLL